MNKPLMSLLAIVLLITGCSSAKATELQTPALSSEIPATAQPVKSESIVVPTSRAQFVTPTDSARAAVNTGAELTDPEDQPVATYTPYPTYTPYSTYTPYPTSTPAPTAIPTLVEMDVAETTDEDATGETLQEPATESTVTSEKPQETPTLAPTEAPAPAPINAPSAAMAQAADMTRIDDPDPAPPLTILVSSILIKGDGYYRLAGTVRNDGSETYGGIGVIATFYENANVCTQREVTRRGRDGIERTMTVEDCDYNWHGPVKVYAACQLLEPGAECPFSLEIYPRDYVSYMLHPEGTPVDYRHPAPLAVSDLNIVNNGLGYLRITGRVSNNNPFVVRDANIAATLTNAAGQIVNVGSMLLPGEMEAGASKSFDLRVEHVLYSYYNVDAQATQR